MLLSNPVLDLQTQRVGRDQGIEGAHGGSASLQQRTDPSIGDGGRGVELRHDQGGQEVLQSLPVALALPALLRPVL